MEWREPWPASTVVVQRAGALSPILRAGRYRGDARRLIPGAASFIIKH